MLSVLVIVLPIFALVAAGWLARRSGALGPHATTELNRFVVYLALPALLFDIVANASVEALWIPGFAATFGLASGSVFTATLLVRRRGSRPLADASIDGLNSAYANTGFIGFPLVLAVLGPESLPPTLIATLITVCALFAIALVLIELGQQTEHHPGRMIGKVAGSLLKNPLLAAPVVGVLVLMSGHKVPAAAETFVKLLGASASPCALIALGLFLAEKRQKSVNQTTTAGCLVFAKLIVHPLIAWALATQVFALPPMQTHCAVLMAALPTGTGPFMLAEFYRREASVTATTILVSTVISLMTVTVYLSYAL